MYGLNQMKKFKNNTIVIYKPVKGYKSTVFKDNEAVLYLGEITNALGHCAVAKRDGVVVWLVHPDEFRLPKKSEI
jgi:hypothetical protein